MNPLQTPSPSSASPDGLARPTGVRRLNKKPLLIALGFAAIVVLALGYAGSQRASANQKKTADLQQPDKKKFAKNPHVLTAEEVFGPKKVDVIAAAVEPGHNPLPIVADGMIAPQDRANGTRDVPKSNVPPPLTEEQKQAFQALQAARQRKLQIYEAALSAPARVDVAVNAPRPGHSQPASPPGYAPGSATALAQTNDPIARIAALQAAISGNKGLADDDAKAAFLKQDVPTQRLPHTRIAQRHRNELKMGTVLPAVMVSGINSDLPGQIIGQIAEDVYDTTSGRILMLPQGAKLVGAYDAHVAYGQSRILVAWYRINYPDGSTLDLGGMPGADVAGYAGFQDRVNHHWASLFGGALLMSAITTGIEIATDRDSGNGFNQRRSVADDIAAAVAQQFGQVGAEIARQQLAVAPTIEIRPGYRFNIMVTKDIVLQSYER